MRNLFIALFILVAINSNAQNSKSLTSAEDTSKTTFVYVEQMPMPPYDLKEYLSKNLHYPDSARKHNVEGRVIVKFVVNKDGHISDSRITKGIGSGCDEEALRVVNKMAPWKPGKNGGKPVPVFFNLPIVFKLN